MYIMAILNITYYFLYKVSILPGKNFSIYGTINNLY